MGSLSYLLQKNMNRIIHEKINGYSNHYSILDNRTVEKKNENKIRGKERIK